MRTLPFCLATLAVVLGLSGCIQKVSQLSSGGSSDDVSGSGGPTKTETRSVGTFRKLRISGAIGAVIKIGSPENVSIEADPAILPAIGSKVDGDTLVIEPTKSIRSSGPIKATITVASLDGIEASGACSVTVSDVKSDQFALALDGASSATVAGDLGQLSVHVNGASTANVSGNATNADLQADGASTIDETGLTAKNTTVNSKGASTIRTGTIRTGKSGG